MVRINLEKLTQRQNSKCCDVDFLKFKHTLNSLLLTEVISANYTRTLTKFLGSDFQY